MGKQQSINPTNEEVLAEFDTFEASRVETALDESARAFQEWRRAPFSERAKILAQVAAVLRRDVDRLATLATQEMGKPVTQARAEVEKCAFVCDHYAEAGAGYLADEQLPDDLPMLAGGGSYLTYDPLGPVLAVMPWNFPFWQVFRCAAPAVMAGNTVLLKHASNVPQCALAIEEIFREGGAPKGLFTTLLLSGADTEPLLKDERISALSFTGSDGVGARLASSAGHALKPAVLELGGSDPFIILADADLEEAVRVGTIARMQNNGESCISAKRFIVQESVLKEFEDRLAHAFGALRVGDPMDPETEVGPLARGEFVASLHDQVERSVDAGARLVTGGMPVDYNGRGFFYAPTLLADVGTETAGWCEETFGPVAALRGAAEVDDAIAAANDTPYGLGAALWTQNLSLARDLAHEIEAGSVFINGMVASDPRRPFGGVKRSGYGRELGALGIRAFTNIKTVTVGAAPKGALATSGSASAAR